jgi:hypothetical protein
MRLVADHEHRDGLIWSGQRRLFPAPCMRPEDPYLRRDGQVWFNRFDLCRHG